jgi:SAM-dependent methyltransferase
MAATAYYQTRLQHDPKRDVLWKTLCRFYFRKLIQPSFHVLELGAGYGGFINHVQAAKRTAVDLWEEMPRFLLAGVEAHVGDVGDLGFLPGSSVDFAFASNLFEHLTQDRFAQVLTELRRVLTPQGTLTILQPNYRYCYAEYFDDYTHVAVYSHISLCDFLVANGFEILHCQPRFLPLTVKSRLPVHPLLIRMYLLSPWKPMGKQMLVRARPVRQA